MTIALGVLIFLVVAAIVCAVLTAITYKAADRPGDDFGAAIPPLFFGLLTIILVIVALAVWKH